jgi:hypothetical protein
MTKIQYAVFFILIASLSALTPSRGQEQLTIPDLINAKLTPEGFIMDLQLKGQPCFENIKLLAMKGKEFSTRYMQSPASVRDCQITKEGNVTTVTGKLFMDPPKSKPDHLIDPVQFKVVYKIDKDTLSVHSTITYSKSEKWRQHFGSYIHIPYEYIKGLEATLSGNEEGSPKVSFKEVLSKSPISRGISYNHEINGSVKISANSGSIVALQDCRTWDGAGLNVIIRPKSEDYDKRSGQKSEISYTITFK